MSREASRSLTRRMSEDNLESQRRDGDGRVPEVPLAVRRAAHERLSTGALSRWTRACAAHPWRVISAWIGIIAALVLLVGVVAVQAVQAARSATTEDDSTR